MTQVEPNGADRPSYFDQNCSILSERSLTGYEHAVRHRLAVDLQQSSSYGALKQNCLSKLRSADEWLRFAVRGITLIESSNFNEFSQLMWRQEPQSSDVDDRTRKHIQYVKEAARRQVDARVIQHLFRNLLIDATAAIDVCYQVWNAESEQSANNTISAIKRTAKAGMLQNASLLRVSTECMALYENAKLIREGSSHYVLQRNGSCVIGDTENRHVTEMLSAQWRHYLTALLTPSDFEYNCLFQAVSIGWLGNSSFAVELRVRTIIRLITNLDHYCTALYRGRHRHRFISRVLCATRRYNPVRNKFVQVLADELQTDIYIFKQCSRNQLQLSCKVLCNRRRQRNHLKQQQPMFLAQYEADRDVHPQLLNHICPLVLRSQQTVPNNLLQDVTDLLSTRSNDVGHQTNKRLSDQRRKERTLARMNEDERYLIKELDFLCVGMCSVSPAPRPVARTAISQPKSNPTPVIAPQLAKVDEAGAEVAEKECEFETAANIRTAYVSSSALVQRRLALAAQATITSITKNNPTMNYTDDTTKPKYQNPPSLGDSIQQDAINNISSASYSPVSALAVNKIEVSALVHHERPAACSTCAADDPLTRKQPLPQVQHADSYYGSPMDCITRWDSKSSITLPSVSTSGLECTDSTSQSVQSGTSTMPLNTEMLLANVDLPAIAFPNDAASLIENPTALPANLTPQDQVAQSVNDAPNELTRQIRRLSNADTDRYFQRPELQTLPSLQSYANMVTAIASLQDRHSDSWTTHISSDCFAPIPLASQIQCTMLDEQERRTHRPKRTSIYGCDTQAMRKEYARQRDLTQQFTDNSLHLLVQKRVRNHLLAEVISLEDFHPGAVLDSTHQQCSAKLKELEDKVNCVTLRNAERTNEGLQLLDDNLRTLVDFESELCESYLSADKRLIASLATLIIEAENLTRKIDRIYQQLLDASEVQ